MVACKPDVVGYSDVPEIRMNEIVQVKDAEGKDSIIRIRIYFQDGDGNIGLEPQDTSAPFDFGSPYFHNLPVTYLVPDSFGEYVPLVNPNNMRIYESQHDRIPNLTPTGKYKGIDGELEILLAANPALLNLPKFKLRFHLQDRALNVSNTITTEELYLTH